MLVISSNIHFYINFQENLEMVMRNGKHKLVGFVELGEAHDHMEKILGEICILIWPKNLFSITQVNKISFCPNFVTTECKMYLLTLQVMPSPHSPHMCCSSFSWVIVDFDSQLPNFPQGTAPRQTSIYSFGREYRRWQKQDSGN